MKDDSRPVCWAIYVHKESRSRLKKRNYFGLGRSLLSFFGCQGLSFSLGWIQKDVELKITKQCTLRFAITEKYIDEVTCEVVPLDVCQVIFGSPYLWDRDAIHYRRLQKYRFLLEKESRLLNTEFCTLFQVHQSPCLY